MTYIPKPKVHHPGLTKNALGLTKRDDGSLAQNPAMLAAGERKSFEQPWQAMV